MKKIGIYSSIDVGEVIDKDIDYIAADGGVEHLLRQDIRPICIIGDLDSIKNTEVISQFNIQRFPPVKDDTDTALAIEEAIRRGYEEIDLYGVTHKRMDHFMAVLCLLKKYSHIHITIYDEYNKIYILKKGKHKIYKEKYKYFSLFSYLPTIVSLSQCHYPLENYLLDNTDPLCVSNQVNDNFAVIEVSEDVLLIQSNERTI